MVSDCKEEIEVATANQTRDCVQKWRDNDPLLQGRDCAQKKRMMSYCKEEMLVATANQTKRDDEIER